MNYKRMLLAALMAYAITFVIGFLFGIIFRFDLTSPSTGFWIITLLTTIIAVIFSSLWYFKTPGNVKEGIFLAISMVVVGFLLDLIILIPVWTQNVGLLLKYYLSYWFLISLFFIIAIPIIIAKIKEE